MGRLFTLILLLATLTAHADWLDELPYESQVLSGYTEADSITRRLAELPLMPGEGLWQMTAQGALFVVERIDPTDHSSVPRCLRLVMVACPMLHIRPGTVFGHAQPTIQPGVLEASQLSGRHRLAPTPLDPKPPKSSGGGGRHAYAWPDN